MSSEELLDEQLRELARELTADLVWTPLGPTEVLDADQLAQYPEAKYVLSCIVFGSNQGPPAPILLRDHLREEDDPDYDEAEIWDEASIALEELVAGQLAIRYPDALATWAYWDDNCLFCQIIR